MVEGYRHVVPSLEFRQPEGWNPQMTTARACPKCGSSSYTFRSRKQIEATPEKGPELETKYRCKDCVRRVA